MSLIWSLRGMSRAGLRIPTIIDFKPIRHISPAAALLLAAELDRWNQLNKQRKLKAVDVHRWDADVRKLLKQMGFFELLGVSESALQCKIPEATPDDPQFLRFYAGEGSGGGAAEELRGLIEALAGKISARYALYDGLVEGMTNVQHHAYPNDRRMRRWWISASVNPESGKLTVLCLDHGVGIPHTLPKKNSEELRSYVKLVGDILKDDAKMIKAAVELRRTSTKKRNRGYGLTRDIRRLISSSKHGGRLRIFSGKGMYCYERGIGGAEAVHLSNLSRPIGGTFIEWVIDNYSAISI
ncbi:hypothetical protein [Lysobacter sp. F6437]|uniref:hypothetical protein n=1 Tax=Lysobacter sp. F6437 TaxID=3459296 RepID=UPI00403E33AA